MYFKVLLGNNVVDLLEHIFYVKHQSKHDLLVLCDMKEAQAILSSNGKYGWHVDGLYNFPPDNKKYTISEITKYEYDQLKNKGDLY